MTGWAALITAIAALIAAIVWPVSLILVFLMFRTQILLAAENVPALVKRMRKVKLGVFEAELEKETEGLVDAALADPGKLTPQQIRSATRVQVAAKALDDSALRAQLHQLSLEFDIVRRTLPPGRERERAMTEVLVKMRTIGPALAHLIGELKASESPGERLAAIAMMQLDPGLLDLDWLLGRFGSDPPFLFFQSAFVLRNAMRLLGPEDDARIRRCAEQALAKVRAYDGEPDANTVRLLEEIIRG
ncbi:hypothetical protein FHS95_000284 [Sphingomonas naasensis]|uniref:Uncharacterized protein n=1 Tax=Sphingomonas naasensis TaxID=1344951 RepID=A0A4V3QXC4_9SPHN|nr:hypothetical protein [Sphingomonas naasensis]NIJ18615.1 hypothetical protein [Sphingomonas naasensis]TGX45862.1 hypothetical protein E5A74_01385 [Sphingomonas naasensis]